MSTGATEKSLHNVGALTREDNKETEEKGSPTIHFRVVLKSGPTLR